MAKNAAAQVTRRTVEELDKLAETVIPMYPLPICRYQLTAAVENQAATRPIGSRSPLAAVSLMPCEALDLVGKTAKIDVPVLPGWRSTVEVLISVTTILFEKPSAKMIRSPKMPANGATSVAIAMGNRSDLR